MKTPHNKVKIDRKMLRKIRLMFFRQVEMKKIEFKTRLTERIIRRIINEHRWILARERYLRFLCFVSFLKNISFVKMARITGVNEYALGRIHRKYKTPKPLMKAWNKKINSKIEFRFVKDYSSGITAQMVAEKYGFKTDKTVLDVLKKNNVPRRLPQKQTFYLENFFEKINFPSKAYILGLIMSDGYIVKDYRGFGIQLTKNDGYILERIGNIIGTDHNPSFINCESRRKTIPNAKDMVRLTITNQKISMDLKKLGVVRNKSKKIRYNNCVPKRYLSHFFRGLIDGDGTVGTNSQNGNIWCQIVSASRGFIRDLCSLPLPFKFCFNASKTPYKDRMSKVYILRVGGGNKATIKFLKWMYKDKGNLYLERKYAKVQGYIN